MKLLSVLRISLLSLGYFLKEIENIFFVFLSSYRNTRESLGELEKYVETLACGLCSHSISRYHKFPLFFLDRNTENVYTCITFQSVLFCHGYRLPGIPYFFLYSFLDAGPCLPNPCENNGTCGEINSKFSCNCTPEFEGERCESGTKSILNGRKLGKHERREKIKNTA